MEPGAQAAPASEARTLRQKAEAAHRAGRTEEAFRTYRAILARTPGDAVAWSNLGVLMQARGAPAAAEQCQRRAREFAPDDPAILGNLAAALARADAPEEELVVRRDLLQRQPDRPAAHAGLAGALRRARRPEAAADAARAGLARWPEEPALRLELGLALLTLGDYEAGFEAYAARWAAGRVPRDQTGLPMWNGEPLSGARLLVIPEQGLGDTLLMARFLPELRTRVGERGGVLLATTPPLRRLFQGLAGADRLLDRGGPAPRADLVVRMMDLPRAAPAARPDAPPPAPALHVPEDSHRRAGRLLAPFRERFRIGVCWTGSDSNPDNPRRSLSPDDFLDLAGRDGASLFSLYKGPQREAFRDAPASALVLDASGADRDLADAAALIDRLHLVISVDTAVAHLSATLGRETWTLLPWSAYWLYGVEGERTPWHPTMRLFRQPAPGDWTGVMKAVAAALDARLRDWRRSAND